MALCKTERGRAALQNHGAGMSLGDRRVLILCDGMRSREDIAALLGAHAWPALERLLDEGYLTLDGAPAHAIAPAAAPSSSRSATPATPGTGAATRRSLVAGKMYLLDMLQLQRDATSARLCAQIRSSPDENELVIGMMDGLRHLQSVATATYAQRVCERLGETLPEAYQPELDRTRAALFGQESTAA